METNRCLLCIVLALGLLVSGCTFMGCKVDNNEDKLIIDLNVPRNREWLLFWSEEGPLPGEDTIVSPEVGLDSAAANQLTVEKEEESGWCYSGGTWRTRLGTTHRITCPLSSSNIGFLEIPLLLDSQALTRTVWLQAVSFKELEDGYPKGDVELSNLCKVEFIAR